jgi:predicted nucleic acid-binding protein
MVRALLDTNILIDYLKGIDQAKVEIGRYDDAAISVITWMEVMIGAANEQIQDCRDFLARFTLIGMDEAVAEAAVSLRRQHRIKLPDAIVWASARSQGRLLVTRNTRDFPTDDPGVRAPYTLA